MRARMVFRDSGKLAPTPFRVKWRWAVSGLLVQGLRARVT